MSVRQLPPAGASFGVLPPTSNLHKWWRINITAKNGSTVVSVGELQFRALVGGATETTGGTALASSNFSGNPPSSAFDGTGTTCWASATSSLPQWIGYQFASAVGVQQILVMSRDSGALDQDPTAWDVQWSNDGVAWTTEWSNTSTGWGVNESRTFNHP